MNPVLRNLPSILSRFRKSSSGFAGSPENGFPQALVRAHISRYLEIRMLRQPLGMDLADIGKDTAALRTLFEV
jgi:hypothetical protein